MKWIHKNPLAHSLRKTYMRPLLNDPVTNVVRLKMIYDGLTRGLTDTIKVKM